MNLFKQFTSEGRQDKISPTYCAAKWFEGTLWLNRGATASCHHTPLTYTIVNKPSDIFNSPRKMADREQMLMGEKPEGCNYCWNIEEEGGVSDRRIKTKSLLSKVKWYKKTELESTPVELEVAFDRVCNLACAYCGPTFSTKWASDINANGPYKNLVTESRYDKLTGFIEDEDNPYIKAFFDWWPELEKTLKVLRITGGEPLMSPNFWKFIEFVNNSKFKGELHINTNLISHKGELDRLIAATKKLKVKIHTSLESSFQQAEYVRHGFKQYVWLNNVHQIMAETKWELNVTTAISCFTVWNYIDYLKYMASLKRTYGKNRIEVTCNFVNYPVFMRIDLIPREQRFDAALEVMLWLNENRKLLNKHEIQQVDRYIKLVSETEQNLKDPHFKLEYALKDIKEFVKQYDERRGISYKALDPRFVKWYESI